MGPMADLQGQTATCSQAVQKDEFVELESWMLGEKRESVCFQALGLWGFIPEDSSLV